MKLGLAMCRVSLEKLPVSTPIGKLVYRPSMLSMAAMPSIVAASRPEVAVCGWLTLEASRED